VIRHDNVVIVNRNPWPSIVKTTPSTVGDSPKVIEHHLIILDFAKYATRIEDTYGYKIRAGVAVGKIA